MQCLCSLRQASTSAARTFSTSSSAAGRQLPRYQKRRRALLQNDAVREDEPVFGSLDEAEDSLRRLALEGHEPGQELPSIAEDPRLQDFKRPAKLRWRDLGEGEPEPGVFSSARMPTNLPTSDSLKAQRIYLPNIRMTLVRNAPVPPSSPRAAQQPYIATFRCSPQLTKPDIVQYLRQCYGIGMRSITTTIYHGPLARLKHGGYKRKYPSYKKVVIGLEEPFEYPEGPNEHELEDRYNVKAAQLDLKRKIAIYGDRTQRGWARRSFRYRGDGEGNVQRYNTIKRAKAARRSIADSEVRAKMASSLSHGR